MNKKKLEEGSMAISSQELRKLAIYPDWTIVKKERKRNQSGKLRYEYTIKCNKCGYLKTISTSTPYKHNVKCPYCEANQQVGKIYSIFKIISFKGWGKKKNDQVGDRLYEVECIKCHKHQIMKLGDIRREHKNCKFCVGTTNDPGINRLINSYKSGAKRRNIEYNLTTDEFLNIVNKNCHYCNEPPKYRTWKIQNKNLEMTVNGIDRIDSAKGYTKENCVPCCQICNEMKLHYTINDFLTHIKKIYQFSCNSGSTTISQESTLQANGNGNGDDPSN